MPRTLRLSHLCGYPVCVHALRVLFLVAALLSSEVTAQDRTELQRLAELVDGQAETVISTLERLVKEQPSLEAHLLLAQAWAQVDANQSLPWLEKVFDEAPEHRQAWQLWADIMTAGRQYEFAVLRLERQLRRCPESAYLHLLLAQLYVNTGAFSKAEERFRRAAQIASDASEIKVQALYSLGFLYVRLGKVEEGERLLRQALDLDGSHVPSLMALASLLIELGNWQEAGRLLFHARDLEPENPEVLVLLGRYYVTHKDPRQAIKMLSGLLERQPEHVQAHFFLGQAYRQAGKLDEARLHFQIHRELEEKKRAQDAKQHRGLPVQ